MDKGFGKGSFLRDAPRFRRRDNHRYHAHRIQSGPSPFSQHRFENFTCANGTRLLDRLTRAFQRKRKVGPPDRRLVKIRFSYRQVSGKGAFLPFTSTMMCQVIFFFFFSLSLRRFLEFVFEAFVVVVLEVEQRCTGEKR